MAPTSSGDLPSGVVTFVFTDIEGSTRLFRRLGDHFVALLERHNELLRHEWRVQGGCEVKTEGDSFFVAFADATAALRACTAAQLALRAEPWLNGENVRVRMGVHAGLADPRGNDYVAFAVHQAARVVAAAHGGQVLASRSTVNAAGEAVDLEVRSLGHYRLRDFDDPVELLQIESSGTEEQFPAVRALPADEHNIVRPRTSFVGRAVEVDELDELMTICRLVTVTGMGGLGKTRLVTEGRALAAMELAESSLQHATTARGRDRMLGLHVLAAFAIDEPLAARESARRALASSLELGSVSALVADYCNVAESSMRLGDLRDAAENQLHALRVSRELGNELGLAFSAIVAARLAATIDSWADATRLSAHGLITLVRNKTPMFPSDQIVTDELLEEARNVQGPETSARLLAEGEGMSLNEGAVATERVLREFFVDAVVAR